jgi:NAD(P)-dependent dehydrogenase (short-subunit alcohol dehydrogenase family)
MLDTFSLKGKRALITGASRGLGYAIAEALASAGAQTILHGRDRAALDRAQAAFAQRGWACSTATCEITDESAVRGMARALLEQHGRIDILVNNAGILRDKAFHNLEWDNLNAVLDTHLRGAFYVTRPAFRKMREQSYGRIVMTSSNSGILGNFGQANYGAAKLGLVGFMNVLKIEGAKYDIKVNAIAPVARTRMTEEILGPVAEKLEPGLVSPVVAYLCSQACSVTGEIYSVAGGTVSRMFIGLTKGWFKHPEKEGALTPEDVEANLATIRDETGYIVPASNQEELQKIAPLLFS